jgi:hypothetical protein
MAPDCGGHHADFVLNPRGVDQMQMETEVSRFQIACKVCDGMGIIFDCPEGAPSFTVIKCRHCGAPRGTLGALRDMSVSGKQDIFEI